MTSLVVTFEKRASKGSPVEPFQAAVYWVSGMALYAMATAASQARPPQLKQVFTSLACGPKPR